MYRLRKNCWGLLWLILLAIPRAQAAQPRYFEEGHSGHGELRYINELPVLEVTGTPEEIGREKSALTGDEVKAIAQYPQQFIERVGGAERWAKLLHMAKALLPQFPHDHLVEIRSFRDHSEVDRDLGIIGNTLPDIYRGGFGCSSLIVEGRRSATGGPLFGRNLDFYSLGILDKYSLVTVYRPKGKHAFVSIGFPGLFGCLSGMNDAGLALAVHEVFMARDHSPMFNPKGVPYTLAFRRVLEECADIGQAERLLRSIERTTMLNLAVCDRQHSAVFEMTPKSLVVRHGSGGICVCTNHFRSPELAVDFLMGCRRYQILSQARLMDKLDVPDVAEKLNEVNLGLLTVQTMIFEPAVLKLHLAIGGRPSSSQPMRPLELGPLFQP